MNGNGLSPEIRRFLVRWIITTIGVLLATSVVKGIECESLGTSIGAALVLGILNAFLRPILLFLSFPLVVLSLGVFALVINAILLYLAGAVVPGFHVESLWSAFWGALLISLVSLIANIFIATRRVARELDELERELEGEPERPHRTLPRHGRVIDIDELD